MSDLLKTIRDQNLGAYRAMPSRVKEDVAQESQIAQDYRGRLTFELLQNADDAMVGESGLGDRITFLLTDEALVVGNSGRALTAEDVEGLCGTGASTKGEGGGIRRASIGHKGMGFKSVLEITDRPEVISDSYAFRLDARQAQPAIEDVLEAAGFGLPKRVPTMRLPWPLDELPAEWPLARATGVNALFRFPLRETLTAEQRALLAQRLLQLPVTAILFLKHLEDVEVEVKTRALSGHFRWRVDRERRDGDSWIPVSGFTESGVYRTHVQSDDGQRWAFLVAHDADVDIGAHRTGLDDATWEGIELAEVSLATPWPLTEIAGLPPDWAKLHVFLPTEEISPYPMLVNGAFKTDLSRQEVRVGEDALDYNRHLLHAAARSFRDRLLPVLLDEGSNVGDVLGLLDRSRSAGSRAPTSSAAILHEAFRAELADKRFISAEEGLVISVSESIVPPLAGKADLGRSFREVLPSDASFADRWFPDAELCGAATSRVLADLGALVLGPQEAAEVLAGADGKRAAARPHAVLGDRLIVDPILTVLEGLWTEWSGRERKDLEQAVRGLPLFPVALGDDAQIRRAESDDFQCFYPPRFRLGEVPLHGLQFMLQGVCWGDLRPAERKEYLREQIPAWQGMFDIREFKFPDVMRASVLPGLELDPTPDMTPLRDSLQSIDALAAICQLAGRTANASAPLPFERLGSNRALFNLSRLRVPCKPDKNGIEYWEPAYKVYFGRDWMGEASIEAVTDAIRDAGGDPPNLPLLAPPSEFLGRLERYSHFEGAAEADEESNDDEVSPEEDEEAALESDEGDRWVAFLSWLGVNRVLRPLSFHDVEDRGSGWLSTAGLRKPQGHAFRGLGEVWDRYASYVQSKVSEADRSLSTPYFFGVHDLDALGPLLRLAKADARTARALYSHLAEGWPQLSPFTRVRLAIVPPDRSPGKRTPPKPVDDEMREPTEDFWVRRLRAVSWVPSTHGPKRASQVWLPSAEIERRFGRRGSTAGDVLPLLEAEDVVSRGRSIALAQLLGIREEFGPATFREADARALLARIAEGFGEAARDGMLEERTLREIIRPAYRNLIELLSGVWADDEDDREVAATLGDSPVLVHDGHGAYRFQPGKDTLYLSRSGTRERLGGARIETFVLEASITARRPLRVLGIRTLEEVLDWTAEPGPLPLDDANLNAFHTGLSELAPYLLARLRAERADERLASRDGARLRSLLGSLQPVESLTLACRLDGRILLQSRARDAFVGASDGQGLVAYVRWGERGWPPSAAEADALATVLLDAFGAGAYEAFLALIRADGPGSRLRLLQLAGAPTKLEEFRQLLFGPESEAMPAADVTPMATATGPATDEGDEWTEAPAAETMGADGATARIPLYGADELLIAGVPVVVAGLHGAVGETAKNGHLGSGDRRSDGRDAIATDLSELDAIGMWVALNFERHRLTLAGYARAEIFAPGQPADEALVFDVSTAGAIERAWDGSQRFRDVLTRLMDRGIQRLYPGFDILTIDPGDATAHDRLIELKSSGVNARVQSMTWNEWKTARDSTLRERFYLYLVSNLRRDLGDAVPYLRAIRDPFGSLWNQEVIESSVERTIQLNVAEFDTADELTLQVRPRNEI